jgi:hypothetical protein
VLKKIIAAFYGFPLSFKVKKRYRNFKDISIYEKNYQICRDVTIDIYGRNIPYFRKRCTEQKKINKYEELNSM